MEIDPEKIKLRNTLFKYGNIIVEAAPGTGKTFTGVYLAREAFRNGWTNNISQTLFLTFSKNARVQIEDEIDRFHNDNELSKLEKQSIQASNYHSFFYEILQKKRGFWGISKLRPATLKEADERKDKLKIKDGIKQGTPRYDDFGLMFYELMMTSSSLCEWLRTKYPFIVLDEFQDTDKTHWDILKLWRPKHIAAFYDRYQMIHSFRDATLDNIQKVIQEYAIPDEAQTTLHRVYRVSDNDSLLDYIYELRLDNLQGSQLKNKIPRSWLNIKTATLNQNPRIDIRCATKIRYMKNEILKNKATAVITRGNNLAKKLQKILSKKPKRPAPFYKCKLISGKEDVAEELRVKLSALRKCDNDKNLRKWFGELFDLLLINPIEISGEKIKFEEHFLGKDKMLTGRRYPLLREIRENFCLLFDSISINNFEGISKLYAFILKYSYELVKGKSFLNPDMLYYIKQFSKVTKAFPSTNTWNEYCDKLESTLLIAGHFRRHMHDGLTILNVHQSKGMQFDHVILAWMSQEGEEPYKGEKLCFDFNCEEERRLLYVAITRAKKRVTIIYPEESPADILKKWKLI